MLFEVIQLVIKLGVLCLIFYFWLVFVNSLLGVVVLGLSELWNKTKANKLGDVERSNSTSEWDGQSHNQIINQLKKER